MTTANPSTAELRAWALDNGIQVADRGRISGDVLDAWKAAHATKPTAPHKSAKPASARPAKVSRASAVAAQPEVSTDAEQQSQASKAEARFTALEQRVQALEHRLDSPSQASKTKRRFLRRSS